MKKPLLVLSGLFLGLLGALFFELAILPLLLAQPWIDDHPLLKNLSRNVINNPVQKIIIQEGDSLRVAVRQASQTVFIIGAKNQKTGCGFALTSDGLLVLDRAWLPVAPSTTSQLIFGNSLVVNSQTIPIKILNNNQAAGLALVKLESKNLKTTSLLGLDSLEVGEKVFILKKAWLAKSATSTAANSEEPILGLDYENIINEGVITRKSAKALETNMIFDRNFGLNPVFNFKGDFVGMGQVNVRGMVEVVPADFIRSLSNGQ
jgi:hypothetical protein